MQAVVSTSNMAYTPSETHGIRMGNCFTGVVSCSGPTVQHQSVMMTQPQTIPHCTHPAQGRATHVLACAQPAQPIHIGDTQQLYAQQQKTAVLFDEKIHVMENGRYVPEEILGKGTYGIVVRCLDRHSNSLVAVKIAHRDAAYRRAALTEAAVLQQLSAMHAASNGFTPGDVVRYVDSFEDSGRVCIVTELLYKNLFEMQRERGFEPLPLEHIRGIARSMLSALARLHFIGHMHCDVKPENIMTRTKTSSVADCCLIDFGAARQLHENQYYDVQSLWYRAPEVLCGVPYTHKIDAWGLGCVLFELHTGTPLIPGEHPADQLERIFRTVGAPPPNYVSTPLVAAIVAKTCPRPMTHVQPHAVGASMLIDILYKRIRGTPEEVALFADLLIKLLSPNDAARLSCSEALSHPFFYPTPVLLSPPLKPSAAYCTPLKAPSQHDGSSSSSLFWIAPETGTLLSPTVSPCPSTDGALPPFASATTAPLFHVCSMYSYPPSCTNNVSTPVVTGDASYYASTGFPVAPSWTNMPPGASLGSPKELSASQTSTVFSNASLYGVPQAHGLSVSASAAYSVTMPPALQQGVTVRIGSGANAHVVPPLSMSRNSSTSNLWSHAGPPPGMVPHASQSAVPHMASCVFGVPAQTPGRGGQFVAETPLSHSCASPFTVSPMPMRSEVMPHQWVGGSGDHAEAFVPLKAETILDGGLIFFPLTQ